MRKIWLLALATALLTTACRVETNVLIKLNADQTGSFGIEFGMDQEFRDLMASQAGDFNIQDLMGGFGAGLPGATVSERTEGDMTFSVFTVAFNNESEFRDLIAGGSDGGDQIDVTWTEDSVTIDATIQGTGEPGLGLGNLGDLGLGDAVGDLGGLDPSAALGNFFSGSVIVDMPGKVSSQNADHVLSDGRLEWDLAFDGSDIQIHAVSDLGGGTGFPSWALLLLILVAAGILVWLFSVQRKRKMLTALQAADAGGPGGVPSAPADWSTPAPHETLDEEGPDTEADEEP